MKKFLVAAAVCMSAGTVTFAHTNDSIPEQKKDSVPVQKTNDSIPAQSQEQSFLLVTQDGYKEVKAEALNEKVQGALQTFGEGYTVKKLEYNESEGLTRVTLEDKATKAEKTVILDSEGREKK